MSTIEIKKIIIKEKKMKEMRIMKKENNKINIIKLY